MLSFAIVSSCLRITFLFSTNESVAILESLAGTAYIVSREIISWQRIFVVDFAQGAVLKVPIK